MARKVYARSVGFIRKIVYGELDEERVMENEGETYYLLENCQEVGVFGFLTSPCNHVFARKDECFKTYRELKKYLRKERQKG